MERRKFTRSLVVGAMTPLLASAPQHKRRKKVKRIKAKALKPGSTVGLIAPASAIKPGQMEMSLKQLNAMGFQVKVGKYAEAENGFLAGDDADRIWDIHNMLMDDEVAGIWCIRGGYGMSRIVPQLNKKLLIKHPKLIIGYSDVTILHQLAATQGLMTIHGQIAGDEFTNEVMDNMKAVITGNLTGRTIRPMDDNDHYTIRGGQAKGQLTGGNLSLLSALAGTPYLDSFKNKVVFIEDLGEKPYRVDRMLTQLIQASDLSKARAIILGVFADCEKDEDDKSWTLREVLEDRLQPLGMPVCYGIPFGHVEQNLAMPTLLEVSIDADRISLTYEEEAVI